MRIVMLVAAVGALGACNRAATASNNSAVPANAVTPANSASASAATATPTPATTDPVRAGIAARWPAGGAVTPAQIQEMVRTGGASEALVALVNDQQSGRWTSVLRGIALGEPGWVEVAALLAPDADGEAAESLFSALTDTLVTSPATAVRLIGADGADGYCTESGGIADAVERRAWYAAAIAGVEGITDPGLQAARTACLAKLRADAPR